MIPLQDLNPTSRRAVLTVLLILLNVAVYFLLQPSSSSSNTIANLKFTYEHAAIPCEVTQGHPLTIDEYRAQTCAHSDQSRKLFPDKNVYLAVLVSMFLHGSLLHIGGNMLFLWIFGNNIEDRMGRVRYLIFYLLGGFAAAAAHFASQPSSVVPVIGASGAIAAVMGAYLVWFPRAPIRTLFFIVLVLIEARWLLLFWFISQFFLNSGSDVAWMAHVGGFIFGMVVAWWAKVSRTGRRIVCRSGALAPNRPRSRLGPGPGSQWPPPPPPRWNY